MSFMGPQVSTGQSNILSRVPVDGFMSSSVLGPSHVGSSTWKPEETWQDLQGLVASLQQGASRLQRALERGEPNLHLLQGSGLGLPLLLNL